MTCGKCERLIKEAVLEHVPEVQDIEVYREQGYATITLKSQANSPSSFGTNIKSKILTSIHSLVNGKFKAVFELGEYILLYLLYINPNLY